MPALTPEQRRVLAVVFAVTVTSIMGNSLLSPAIPDVLAEFDRPDSSAGLLVAAVAAPGVLVAPVIGLLADRWGRRNVLVPCLAVFGAAGLFVAAAPTFWAMVAGRFVMGFGAAGLINLGIVLIGDHFPSSQRTHWLGRNSAVLTGALALMPVFSGLVTDAAGWRWALAPYGLALVMAAVVWFVLDSRPPDVVPTLREQLAGMRLAVRDPAIVITFVGGAVAFAVMFGVFLATLPGHLEDGFGLSAGPRGIVIGLPALTSTAAAFNLGRIHRRHSGGVLLIASAAAWAVAFAMIGLAGVLAVLIAGTLLYGAAEGVIIPTLQSTAIDRAPSAQRAAVMATWTGAARLGQAAGPLIAAAILSRAATTGVLMVGAAASAALAIAFALSPVSRRREPA